MRDYILLYINGQRKIIQGEQAFLSLSDYLRYEQRLTGTKVVCAEGDCGACSVLQATVDPLSTQKKLSFKVINSCIAFVHLMDCSHILTVEGLVEKGNLHPIQQSLLNHHGSQCGFCTPGFVMSLAGLFEAKNSFTNQNIKNFLTGNLCRCTGYLNIITSALNVDRKGLTPLKERYHCPEMMEDLEAHFKIPVNIHSGEKVFSSPTRVEEAIVFKKEDPRTRIFGSATDLGVQMNKGRLRPSRILSLNLIEDLYDIREEVKDQTLVVGARVSLNLLAIYMETRVPEFSRFLNVFASPQIKNCATLVGNIANASPIGDTLPYLFICEAQVEIQGARGQRLVPIRHFYKGYKKLDLEVDEIITKIHIPLPRPSEKIKLYKVSQRKDLDISCINAGFLISRDKENTINDIRISYGGVGPTTLRLSKTEDFLKGKKFTRPITLQALQIAQSEISPLSDVRGSADHRALLAKNLFLKFYHEVQNEPAP